MKIDFNAGYKGVSELVFKKEASSADPSVRAQFGKLVRQAEQNSLKELEIIKKNNIFNTAETDKGGTVTRPHTGVQGYTMPPPVTIIPQVARHSITADSVNGATGPVKTPTVLEARRVGYEYEVEPTKAHTPESARGVEAYRELITSVGGKHGVDPALGLAVARAESSFNPKAVSSDGHASKGLFQLLDTTGKDMMSRLSVSGGYDPFNPELNTELGVGYLRYLHDIFSTEKKLPNNLTTRPAANSTALEKLAVAAFNAGEGRVASAQQRALADGYDPSVYEDIESYLPTITQEYVRNVTRYRDEFDPSFEPEFNG